MQNKIAAAQSHHVIAGPEALSLYVSSINQNVRRLRGLLPALNEAIADRNRDIALIKQLAHNAAE